MSSRERELVVKLDQLVSGAANLVAIGGRPDLEALPVELRETAESVPWASATMLAHWGGQTHVLRALWAVARSGKRGLDELKAMQRKGALPADRLYRELALGAIAAASPKLRGEARKALGARSHGDDLDDMIDELIRQWSVLIEGALDDPESVRHVEEMGAMFVAGMVAGGVEAPEEEVEKVPKALARAAFVSLPSSLLTKGNTYMQFRVASALPWLAQASAEELFLPVAWTEAIVPEPGSMDTIEVWLRPFLETYGARKRAPTRREGPEVGRNDPCPCGSGKKYKRCHGLS